MVQIIGTYQLTSQENYDAYLKATGIKDELVQKAKEFKQPLIVSALDNSKITLSYAGKEVTFVFNKETEHTLPPGINVNTTASINGDTLTLKTKAGEGRAADERVLKFTDSGVTSTSTVNGVTAIRHYKRV